MSKVDKVYLYTCPSVSYILENVLKYLKSKKFICQTKNGIYFFILYVYDVLLFGDADAMKEANEHICKDFKITTAAILKDYLGVKITLNDTTKRAYTTQPFLLDKMFIKYGPEFSQQNFKTRGTPGFVLHLKGKKCGCSSNIKDEAL